MKEGGHRALKGVVIVVIVFFLMVNIIFGSLLAYDNFIHEEPKRKAALEVEDVYFVFRESTDGLFHVEVGAFITNTGDEECGMRIRAFAIDADSNIANDDSETVEVKVSARTTIEADLEFELEYNGTFRVELMIFKDGMITAKGTGTINLADRGSGGRDYRTTMGDEETEKEDASALPFPALALLVPAVVLFAFMIRRRRWSA